MLLLHSFIGKLGHRAFQCFNRFGARGRGRGYAPRGGTRFFVWCLGRTRECLAISPRILRHKGIEDEAEVVMVMGK